jgi:hypothetical protein
MLKALTGIGIFSTQPGTAHATGYAVVVRGGFQANQCFSGACHETSLLALMVSLNPIVNATFLRLLRVFLNLFEFMNFA